MATPHHRVELTVELDLLREPITGHITDSRACRRSFAGWLELMDLLDNARHRAGPRTVEELRDAADAGGSDDERQDHGGTA